MPLNYIQTIFEYKNREFRRSLSGIDMEVI